MAKKTTSMKKKRLIADIASYVTLAVLGALWVSPLAVLIITSLRNERSSDRTYLWPKEGFSFHNYVDLFTETDLLNYPQWLSNTFIVAIFTCIISTFMVLSVAYTMSRLRFKMRKSFMNIALVLGMFPGFMSMIAIYLMFVIFELNGTLVGLVVAYSAGTGLGFFVAKGFFDTIPKAIDEAAMIDGASRWTIFYKITVPLSKPIIIYTIFTSFMSAWTDFIFVSVLQGDKVDKYTVAVGLYTMLDNEYISEFYTRFCAGSVLIAVPLTILFICMQKYYTEGVTGAVKG
jgi:arabinogalactan oligomer/maltooligosaccharide transport system permease protein